MFCTSCGREIANGTTICPFCGMGQRKVEMYQQNMEMYPQKKYVMALNRTQFGADENDKKFNIWAFLFPLFWTAAKEIWPAVGINLVISVVGWIIVRENIFVHMETVVFYWLIEIIWAIYLGTNGNYFYRLQTENNIKFFDAVKLKNNNGKQEEPKKEEEKHQKY